MIRTSWTTQDKYTEQAQWQLHFARVQLPPPPTLILQYIGTLALLGGDELHQAGILKKGTQIKMILYKCLK